MVAPRCGEAGAGQATAEAPVELYLEGRGVWCQVPDWPVPGTSPLVMQLLDNDSCRGHRPALPLLKLSSDATVGAASALGYHQARGLALPSDQSAENGRSLSFTSELLGGALVICGRPKVTAVVRCGLGAGHTFVAKLLHVAPDGSSSLITWGARALAAHDGDELPENGSFDETVPVEMAPTVYEVPEGHNLRLRLHGGEFPKGSGPSGQEMSRSFVPSKVFGSSSRSLSRCRRAQRCRCQPVPPCLWCCERTRSSRSATPSPTR